MNKHFAPAQSHFWAIVAILIFAVAFGGGGSKYGMANLLVQLAALTALAFHGGAFFSFWKSSPLALRVLIALSLLLPAAYLIPLPQSMWSALPGREMVVQSYELIGETDVWSPASVEPVRTLLALTALITPLAVATIGWSAPRDRLITAGWVLVALGLINFLIGIPQVLSNSEVGVLYPENPMPGVLFGTFANRNSTGVFLVSALAIAAMLPVPARFQRAELAVRATACVLLVVAILLTRSRTALVLALIPLAAMAVRWIIARPPSGRTGGSSRRAMVLIAAAVLAIGLLGVLTVAAPGRVGDVIERFEGERTDARTYIWEDATYAAGRHWPAGSGMGTFDDVFQVDESLENMTPRRAGRAHNDYLEVAIEAGLPGLVLIGLWLMLVAWLAWRARESEHRWIAWSGGVILLTIALQSITDYPLRNQTMMAVGAFALLLLAKFGAGREEGAA